MDEATYKAFGLAIWSSVFQFLSIFSADLADHKYGMNDTDALLRAVETMTFGLLYGKDKENVFETASVLGAVTLTEELANWHIIANACERGFTEHQISLMNTHDVLSETFELWDSRILYSRWEKPKIDMSDDVDVAHVLRAGVESGVKPLVTALMMGVTFSDITGQECNPRHVLQSELDRRRRLREQ